MQSGRFPEALKLPLLFILIFYSIAFWRYLATGNVFYIYNFVYIGTALAVGIFLSETYPLWGRRITQLLIGTYMLGYVGFILGENMQIEGFFFYLFAGIFAAATLHYFIAKVAGPLIFGRGWCAWACWTAMVLDFLPWKRPPARIRNLGFVRYLHFFVSLAIVSYAWFVLGFAENEATAEATAVCWLFVGNVFYYVVAIFMAFILKDNRAFCKYVCPIPATQKITSRFSLLKMEIDGEKCNDCHLCEKNCPMGIEMLKYRDEGKRNLSTECILCTTCQEVCPQNAIRMTMRFDGGIAIKEYLRYKEAVTGG